MSTPSLTEATAELVEASRALDEALSEWWRNPEADVSRASERWWIARKAYSRAITEPVERAS